MVSIPVACLTLESSCAGIILWQTIVITICINMYVCRINVVNTLSKYGGFLFNVANFNVVDLTITPQPCYKVAMVSLPLCKLLIS